MEKKIEEHIFQGMQRDMSISKQKPEYLWDANNIRLTTRHGETLLSMTNERGTKEYSDIQINGVVLGYCVLGDYLTVFTKDADNENSDYIYRLQKSQNGFNITTLYNGNLNFKLEYPIECLAVYENEDIQKVYWTDGINQPRFINITKDKTVPVEQMANIYTPTSFDFIPTLSLQDEIYVQKIADSSGLFPAGVIQYAVTYYTKYGQESNVSVISPLIPTSYTSRAGSPEDIIGNAFKVTIRKPDTQFEFLRLYSIFRSSKNTTPVCKRVADVRLGYGGNTSGSLYKSNDAFTRRYGRIDIDRTFFKTSYTSTSFTDLLTGATLCSDPITVMGIDLDANTYYHFSKQQYPNLLIKAFCYTSGTSPKDMYFTWGSCTDIYISTQAVNGPAPTSYPIIIADGGLHPNMLIASDIHYQYDDFINNQEITITDNNTVGEEIDYNELLFVGGEEITAGTITLKDGTMFLGDINVKRPQIIGEYIPLPLVQDTTINNNNIVDSIRRNTTLSTTHRTCCFPITMNSSSYKWGNTLDAHFCDVETVIEDNVEETHYIDTGKSTNIGGFKYGEHYRLGLLFQYKTGKWSQPVFINDITNETERPSLNILTDKCILFIPTFTATLTQSIGLLMIDKNYLRVRPVVCFPTESDQLILCQGLLNPTVHSIAGRLNHTPDVLSSWFFRPIPAGTEWNSIIDEETEEVTSYVENQFEGGIPQYKHGYTLYGGYITREPNLEFPQSPLISGPYPLRHDEIQGVPSELSNIPISDIIDEHYELLDPITITGYAVLDVNLSIDDSRDLANIFVVDWKYLTFHSPEFEFNDSFHNIDSTTLKCQLVGKHLVASNLGDIHIITSSSPISTDAPGFFHRTIFTGRCAYRINAGLFYRDALVGLTHDKKDYTANNLIWNEADGNTQIIIRSFLTYPWHRTGSLNNDCIRPEATPNRSAVLSQKKMINIMYFGTQYPTVNEELSDDTQIKTFDSDLIAVVKINDMNYFGNIDQVLSSHVRYPIAYAEDLNFTQQNLAYVSRATWNLFEKKANGLMLPNDPVYMKYKSTPHAIMYTTSFSDGIENHTWDDYNEPIDGCSYDNKLWPYLYCAEVFRDKQPDTDFGGTSPMAIHNNLWYPAGPATEINPDGNTIVEYMYGDTYYQRYDCLKTYPFTDEDTNSIIEIGSFMVETRINLDGRYDRNRGNTQNFMLNPTNFNLINPVYSQMDNFFNYRILDEDYYALSKYPTMISWTGYKNNAAEVDNWTNITLASTLEMDGTKGKVNAVRVNSDQLYCFQDDAVGLILFNSRVQISPSDGVPIEISNNYKVDGNRYISTSIGCKNKWSIVEGADGIYFIDDNTKSLYLLAQSQLKPISTPLNMSYWFMLQDTVTPWIQHYWSHSYEIPQQGIRCFYDNANADLYICTGEKTLCYSEKLGQFVSFFDYHNVIGMFNIDSEYYALNYPDNDTPSDIRLWGMFQGSYNTLFNKIYPSDFTVISNENPLNDKIFTNIELRGDFRYWPKNNPQDDFYSDEHMVDHSRMFDTIKVWNEYQDTGTIDLRFIRDDISNMKKKFRIWRMDIPRDTIHPRQRIRNTWTKLKFTMNTIPEITLEELCKNTSSEFMVHNQLTDRWLDVDFRDTDKKKFTYDPEEDKITETFTGNDVAYYTLNGNFIMRHQANSNIVSIYAYRKLYDMEIHDVGVVYFV